MAALSIIRTSVVHSDLLRRMSDRHSETDANSELGLPRDASWSATCAALARRYGASSSSWDDVLAADYRHLATNLGIPPSSGWNEIYQADNRQIATALGIPPSSSWYTIYHTAEAQGRLKDLF
jgi:lambda repressor-like predicted transcriptional regulator